MTPGLDIVITLRDLSDLPLLNRCLFTVFAQRLDVPLSVHLMLPRFSLEDLQQTRGMTDRLRGLAPDATLYLHNWTAPGPLDLRMPLLNWSIEVAQSRYFTVIEVADLLSTDALRALRDRLHHDEAALAEAALVPQAVAWWGDAVLPLARSSEVGTASCFMIDRRRVQLRDLVFLSGPDDEMTAFLASIGARYPRVLLPRETPLGVRQLPQ